ncbi:MAG: hypothetical protein M5U09_14665 [Gammaproteobacteria bacterium]|nr:hypothetical protein [Gammaproteobacteria bacterium]
MVTNLVLSSADAFVRDSVVTAHGTAEDSLGDLTVKAENASLLDATLLASTQTGDTAVGVTLAFNTIGWKPQNVLFNAIDALLGDPLLSKAFDLEQPARTEAYVLNSRIDIAGDLLLDALGNTQLNATVSNAAESNASALKGAGGKGFGGVLASNKVSTNVRAYIDYENGADFTSADGNRTLQNGDWVEHDGAVYEYLGRVDTIDLSDDEQDYADNGADWKLVTETTHGVATDVDAGGGVAVNAEDNAGIYSNIKLVASSVTTNDGGAGVIQETISDLVPVDYDSGNPLYADPIALQFGDRVRVADDHEAGGEAGSVYRYMGPGAGEEITLSEENYDNLDLWKIEPESNIIPDGINITDSNSIAAGGMVVVNDVRSGVDAFINESTVDAAGGDIVLAAVENATIRATADSTAESDGGGSVDGSQETPRRSPARSRPMSSRAVRRRTSATAWSMPIKRPPLITTPATARPTWRSARASRSPTASMSVTAMSQVPSTATWAVTRTASASTCRPSTTTTTRTGCCLVQARSSSRRTTLPRSRRSRNRRPPRPARLSRWWPHSTRWDGRSRTSCSGPLTPCSARLSASKTRPWSRRSSRTARSLPRANC